MKRLLRLYEMWVRKLSKVRSRHGLYGFLDREYATIPPGAKVLTIGAGGEVSQLLTRYADSSLFEVISIDIDRGRSPQIVGDVCKLPLCSNVFDIVVLSEVLEHVECPSQGIANLRMVLKEGGRLILSVPFILPLHDRPTDYFRFTCHGLELLLGDFQQVQIVARDSYFEAIDVLWVRLLQANQRAARLLSFFVIPFVFFVKRPVTVLLGRVCGTDAMTTGYVATAVK